MPAPAFGASYVVENDKIFAQTIADAQQIVSDLRVPFGLIGRDFYRSQKAPFSLKSPGLYPDFKGDKDPETGHTKYQAQKLRKVGFDYPLLVRTGALAASVLAPNARGSIYQVTPLSLAIGTTISYGIYHQSDAPRKKIPLRKFIFIGPEAPRFANSDQQGRLQRWVAIIQDYAAKQFAKKGLQK